MTVVLCAVGADGEVVAQVPNSAVCMDLLKEIRDWKAEKASELNVLTRLRQRTVPSGYTPHSWQAGMYFKLECSSYTYIIATE